MAGRLEDRHALAGAVRPTPTHLARLLRSAVPLLEHRPGELGVCRIVIEPLQERPAPLASLLIQVGPDAVAAADFIPGAGITAQARGTIVAWCHALLDGDRSGIGFRGDIALAERLVAELYDRLPT